MRSRFVRCEQVAGDLTALGARVKAVKEQYTYWVLARKGG
jgi:hypothetical protein